MQLDELAAAGSRLQIRRLRTRYLVSDQHPAPERLQTRLDEAARRGLSAALSATLARCFPERDPSLWLIRRLEVNLDVNAAWEPEVVARAWSARVARELASTLGGGADGQNVLWFPHRSAYLAQFVVDLAAGQAWTRWYYESLSGLRHLPTSAALRTVLCEQAEAGRAALRALAPAALRQVLHALTSPDARRILEAFAAAEPAGEVFLCLRTAWLALDRAFAEEQVDEEAQQALWLYLVAGSDRSDIGGRPLSAAAWALVTLARRLAGDAGAGESIRTALIEGDAAALFRTAGASDAAALAPLLEVPPEWLGEVARALLARQHGEAPVQRTAPDLPRRTPFGGAFLLLPLLDELPLAEMTRGWPEVAGTDAAALIRLLLLSKCLGQPRGTSVFQDPLLRELTGISPTLSLTDVAGWQKQITARQQQTLLASLETWHRQRGAVQGQSLVLARVPLRGRPIALLLDTARGLWLSAGGYPARRLERLVTLLRGRLEIAPAGGGLLLADPLFLEPLRSAFPHWQVVSLREAVQETGAAADDPGAALLARLNRLPEDLAYLSLPPAWGAPRSFDLMLSVAAQGLLRSLAWRLPGFAASNLPYLHRNFLEFAASVEEEPTRRVVRLGRPPLHLVLNLTGMARATYTLTWQDERPFALFPED